MSDHEKLPMVTAAVSAMDSWRESHFTSADSSVNEFRGRFDVANLSSLLGLYMERAKSSISKDCRYKIMQKAQLQSLIMAPLATSGVFGGGNDDTRPFTKYEGIRSHVRTPTKVESKNSHISDVILPSIVDEKHDMQSQ
ncbi:hypothetical protein NC651_002377 [Populus alba x Populus x berolinensis]|nr:hypothetical protein NC651_002377 [Populus alba x Populus x berolinensis]